VIGAYSGIALIDLLGCVLFAIWRACTRDGRIEGIIALAAMFAIPLSSSCEVHFTGLLLGHLGKTTARC